MTLIAKIKHAWGYEVGVEPPSVVLQNILGTLSIAYWPTENPPTIAEIEAVELPAVEPTPDWAAFEAGVNDLSFYASKILLAPASNLFPALIHNVGTQNTARVGQLLNLMVATYSLTENDVTEFQSLLNACHIRITIGN